MGGIHTGLQLLRFFFLMVLTHTKTKTASGVKIFQLHIILCFFDMWLTLIPRG